MGGMASFLDLVIAVTGRPGDLVHQIAESPNHQVDQLGEVPCEHAQWPPWAPHEGMASASRRPAAPTLPGLDNSFCRSAPWHSGQAAGRSAVTNASKCWPHPR